MKNIKIEKSERSPGVDFDFSSGIFYLTGESYPEDVSTFYSPVMDRLTEYLGQLKNGKVEFNFELIYFNSSSAKIIMELFDQLDESAGNGSEIVINWHYNPEDDTMQELGEEFGEDLENVTFNLKAKEA